MVVLAAGSPLLRYIPGFQVLELLLSKASEYPVPISVLSLTLLRQLLSERAGEEEELRIIMPDFACQQVPNFHSTTRFYTFI